MTSTNILKILAALIWYTGAIILTMKSRELIIEAVNLEPAKNLYWIAIISGLLIGGLKAKFIFVKSCKKNMKRIDSLATPKIWQFYKPGFFLFLAIMMPFGATLSRIAHGNYIFLLCVATLDISLATALLGSSYVYWKQKIFIKGFRDIFAISCSK
ncbi:MAG: hypothetical protein JEZ06_12100 [Anaerolineaceae bacterium]|nr:hypothetical protein [Anaerolineaceae bacterium]